MIDIGKFRKLALSFPGATEQPHFHKTSFCIKGKIFATLEVEKQQANVKLSIIDQDVFAAFDKSIIFPVANKWGKQGWTTIDLQKIPESMLTDILGCAFCEAAPKKIAALLRPGQESGEEIPEDIPN